MNCFENTSSGANQLILVPKQRDLGCFILLVNGFDEDAELKTKRVVSLLHFPAVNVDNGHQNGLCPNVEGEKPILNAIRTSNVHLAQKLLEMSQCPVQLCNVQLSIELTGTVQCRHKSLLREVDDLAAKCFNVEVSKWLMRRGVEPNDLSNKNTIAQSTVPNLSFISKIIRYIAAWKLELYESNEQGEMLNEVALGRSDADAALDLLKMVSDLRKDILIDCVAPNELKSVVVQMVKKSQDQMLDSGRNLLHVAAEKFDVIACQLLLRAGMDVKSLSRDSQASALHFAALNKVHGEDLVKYFIESGLSLCKTDREGLTPLHYALSAGNLEVADVLITKGANVKAKVNGINLLFHCAKANNLRSVKFVHSLDKKQIKELSLMGMDAEQLSRKSGVDHLVCRWLVDEINAALLDQTSFRIP